MWFLRPYMVDCIVRKSLGYWYRTTPIRRLIALKGEQWALSVCYSNTDGLHVQLFIHKHPPTPAIFIENVYPNAADTLFTFTVNWFNLCEPWPSDLTKTDWGCFCTFGFLIPPSLYSCLTFLLILWHLIPMSPTNCHRLVKLHLHSLTAPPLNV